MSNIDWSQMITQAMKDAAAQAAQQAQASTEQARLRSAADYAIAPLQDAVDIDEATDADVALLKAWKKYRIALNKIPDQIGYPGEIAWPAIPA
jgi:hypothetical protein